MTAMLNGSRKIDRHTFLPIISGPEKEFLKLQLKRPDCSDDADRETAFRSPSCEHHHRHAFTGATPTQWRGSPFGVSKRGMQMIHLPLRCTRDIILSQGEFGVAELLRAL
jgi:hypothetical protein